jgi:hypothetical protein
MRMDYALLSRLQLQSTSDQQWHLHPRPSNALFPGIGGVSHTHSTHAVAFAQARRSTRAAKAGRQGLLQEGAVL